MIRQQVGSYAANENDAPMVRSPVTNFTSDLYSRFTQQPDSYKLFLELLAFLDAAQTPGQFTPLYAQASQKVGGKRVVYKAAVEELLRQGLLEGSPQEFACAGPIIEDVAYSAALRGTATALHDICSASELGSRSALSRWRRLYHCGYKKELLNGLMDSSVRVRVVAGISSPSTFEAFRPETGRLLASHILMLSLSQTKDVRPFLRWIEPQLNSSDLPEPAREVYAAVTLFSSPEGQIASTPSAITRAVADLLTGDRARGLEAIKALLRKTPEAHFPMDFQEFLWLAACMAQGQEETAQWRVAYSRPSLRNLMGWLLAVRAKQQTTFTPEVSEALLLGLPEIQLMAALCIYWSGLGDRLERDRLARLQSHFGDNGLGLLQQEVGGLMAILDGEQETAGPIVSLLTPAPAWENILERLDGWAGDAPSALPLKTRERVIWMVDMDERGLPRAAAPKQQKWSAKGDWTSGKVLSLFDLAGREGLDQHDRQVVDNWKLRRQEYLAGAPSHGEERKQLMDLIGHPRLYDAEDTRRWLTFSAATPQLHLERLPSGFRLTIEPVPVAAETCLATELAEDHFGLLEVTPRLRELWALLGDSGTLMPAQAAERAHATLSRLLGQELEITGDLPDGLAGSTMQQADTRLRVRLSPSQGGLNCLVRVQPLEHRSDAYPPGEGPEALAFQRSGRSVQVRRDLVAERAAFKKLRKAVPLLKKTEIHFESPHDCLDLLADLREQSPSLVLIEWPQGQKIRLREKLDAGALQLRAMGSGEWFEMQGSLSFSGDEQLSLADVLARLREKERFIRLEDGSYLALTEELRRRLNLVDRASQRLDDGPVRVHHLASSLFEDIDIEGDQSWLDAVRKVRWASELEVELPDGFLAELRGYQEEGFRWLARAAAWGVGVCLADDMGLGKTVQTLALLCRRQDGGPALVVAPTSVGANWIDEAERFAPGLRAHMYSETERAELLQNLGPGTVVVCTYGLLVRDIEALSAINWHTVVLDEAQAIKNSATQRAKAALSLKADFRLTTTGTPVENHLEEVWAMFRFLNPGFLGSKRSFADRFGTVVQLPEARAALAALIRPFVLRRLKSNVLQELPGRTDITLRVELSREERVFYEGLRRDAVDRIERSESKMFTVLVELTRLRRACCHPSLVDPGQRLESSKLHNFSRLLQEIVDGGHKALVFSQFVDYLKLATQEADKLGLSYQYLDGSTPVKDRRNAVSAFQAGEGQVFFISLKAGGFGLNLTAASYVIHLDPWWNPAVEDQASDRAHRIGQTEPVTVYRLIASNTIEEKILRLHSDKRELADQLLAGTDQAATLNAQEILALLSDPISSR